MGGHRSTHQSRHRVPSTVATTCDGGTRCPSGDQSLSLSFSLFGVSFLVGRAGEEMSDGKGHEDDSRGIMKCWDGHRWCGSVSSRASSLSIVVIILLSTRIPDAQAAVAVAIIAVALARIKLLASASEDAGAVSERIGFRGLVCAGPFLPFTCSEKSPAAAPRKSMWAPTTSWPVRQQKLLPQCTFSGIGSDTGRGIDRISTRAPMIGIFLNSTCNKKVYHTLQIDGSIYV
ncbi:unnamed protein product [Musa banksii]